MLLRTRTGRCCNVTRMAGERIKWDWLVNTWAASPLTPQSLRAKLYSAAGAKLGRGVSIRRRVDVYGPALTLGDGVFINNHVTIQNAAPVAIGNDVLIGPRAAILTASHEIGTPAKRAAGNTTAPVTIGAGSWIGAGARILPGVTIGEGVVVGAGALVTKDCEANGLYVGSPATRARDL